MDRNSHNIIYLVEKCVNVHWESCDYYPVIYTPHLQIANHVFDQILTNGKYKELGACGTMLRYADKTSHCITRSITLSQIELHKIYENLNE